MWELRRCRGAVGSAGAYERIRPKLTTTQIRLRRPKEAATGLLSPDSKVQGADDAAKLGSSVRWCKHLACTPTPAFRATNRTKTPPRCVSHKEPRSSKQCLQESTRHRYACHHPPPGIPNPSQTTPTLRLPPKVPYPSPLREPTEGR